MTSASAPAPADPVAESAWWLLLALGIITIGFGVAVLVWPAATLLVLAVLFGFWLIVAGVLRLVAAFAEKSLSTGWRVFHGVLGVLLVGAGISALTNLVASLGALVFVVGFFFIVDGVDDLLRAITGRTSGSRGWLAFVGVLGIVAGAIVLSRPGVGLATLVLLVGWLLIGLGVLRIIAALALRRLTTAA
jgi:uncharacterized membrane protein HdeD (DUF308 family)